MDTQRKIDPLRRTTLKVLGITSLAPLQVHAIDEGFILHARSLYDPLTIFLADLLKRAYAKLDVAANVKPLEVGRAMQKRTFPGMPKTAKKYAFAGITWSYSKTPNIPDLVRLEAAIFVDEVAILVRKKSLGERQTQALGNLKICADKQLSDSELFIDSTRTVKIHSFRSIRSSFVQLKNGECDAVIASKVSIECELKRFAARAQLDPKDFVELPNVSWKLPVYHFLFSESAEFLPSLQTVIADESWSVMQRQAIEQFKTSLPAIAGSADSLATTPEDFYPLLTMRPLPYSMAITHQGAIDAGWLSNEYTTLIVLLEGGWSWNKPGFQTTYQELLKELSDLQNQSWDQYTYPALHEVYSKPLSQRKTMFSGNVEYAYVWELARHINLQDFYEVLSFYESTLGQKFLKFLDFLVRSLQQLRIAKSKQELGFPSSPEVSQKTDWNGSQHEFERLSFEIVAGHKDYAYYLNYAHLVPGLLEKFTSLMTDSEKASALTFLQSKAARGEIEAYGKSFWAPIGQALVDAERKSGLSEKIKGLKSKWAYRK
ncbi:hypothetical protein RF679_00955 [Undibacterium cyanobacteriorum]|uniref:Solute-binding protein family 3/N-terminal domain-containing protein n=1 Tax=Undibacterium cyanobacteriorum TaxID=3073561 RepID=A0ABY9RJN8_9BURK|nr:hypothetical protein [Undibacterium sp. 20NA77.5]WMW80865.1 hypothetical protein RF679_00955 [Undibacterium sp. 20NA77.5]